MEDDPNIAKLMEATDAIGGYESEVCNNGPEAFEKIDHEKFDLILLDIAMPDMDGLETYKRMKNYSVDIPVIFLTASGHEDDVLSAIRLGAINYLKKPFLPQELLRRIALGLGEK